MKISKPCFIFWTWNNPNKYWNDINGCEIIKHVHNQVLTINKFANQTTMFVTLTSDDVTNWIIKVGFFNSYCVQDWCRILILFSLKCIPKGFYSYNLTKVIMNSSFIVKDLIEVEVSRMPMPWGSFFWMFIHDLYWTCI
jgi:hypothetical protein